VSESKYKCDHSAGSKENHNMTLVCEGCLKAWIARHDKMKEILIRIYKGACCAVCNCHSCDALYTLRELGFEK
jgi:hypothetical protein